MSDWNVYVDNQVEVTLDADTFALLTEIRDLLKQINDRQSPVLTPGATNANG